MIQEESTLKSKVDSSIYGLDSKVDSGLGSGADSTQLCSLSLGSTIAVLLVNFILVSCFYVGALERGREIMKLLVIDSRFY